MKAAHKALRSNEEKCAEDNCEKKDDKDDKSEYEESEDGISNKMNKEKTCK